MTTRSELGTLEASGLIQLAALEPELEYLFRHALVQEAAYSSLLKQDRRGLHRRAAEILLRFYPDRRRELAGVIAMHYERAGDTRAALPYLVAAGEHSLERFANREAAAFFERAYAYATDDAQRDPAVALRAAVGATRAGWTFTPGDVALSRLESAIAAAGETDRRLAADAYFWIAFVHSRRGHTPEANESMRNALRRLDELSSTLGDDASRAMPEALLGIAYVFTGRFRPGAELLEKAVSATSRGADDLATALMSDVLAIAYARLGDFDAADRTVRRSDALAAKGDPIAKIDVTLARAMIAMERGELPRGVELATECALRSEELGAVACGAGSNVARGFGLLAADDAAAARAPLERGRELAIVANMQANNVLAEGLLGAVKGRLGDLASAANDWNSALALARAGDDHVEEAMIRWTRGRTYMRAAPPDHAAAIADLDAAVVLFETMEARPTIARVERDRADVLAALGRTQEAEAARRRANELARAMGLVDFAP
jgi:tetratricopeptide (TPR) repeat protein